MKKTEELFDEWNVKKKSIEFENETQVSLRVGEFRWYWEGMNIGNEISKDKSFQRVCLVLKTNMGNGLILIIPLTTKYHHRLRKWYIQIRNYDSFDGLKPCWGIVNQCKLIDRKRFSDRVCKKRTSFDFIRLIKRKYYACLK